MLRWSIFTKSVWDAERTTFVDPAEKAIRSIFRLTLWEWLLRDRFAEHFFASYT